MWNKLGFKQNPYDTRPLQASPDDVDLLIGREEESVDFATALDSANSGVTILSGVPGVGKTSFLNVQQFLLETEQRGFGPKILAARQLCPVWSNDTPGAIAIRALTALVKSLDTYCEMNKVKLPPESKKIKKWLSNPKDGGFDVGISAFGFGANFGRSITVPPLNDATFETINDIIEIIVEESCKKFSFNSVVICLDNVENLDNESLMRILMTFRDTLFSINKVWWVLIGQTDLSSLILSLDQRIFQRTTYSIELKPIGSENLKIAIDKRVSRFHKGGKGKSPVSEFIYSKLYDCSNGEIRFVLKYCSDICISFIQRITKEILGKGKPQKIEELFNEILGKQLVNNQIKDETALEHLKKIVTNEFQGLHLKQKELQVLAFIGKNGRVRPKDYNSLGLKSATDFSSNYLNKLASQYLLLRKQEGRAVLYELRGLGMLASEFELL